MAQGKQSTCFAQKNVTKTQNVRTAALSYYKMMRGVYSCKKQSIKNLGCGVEGRTKEVLYRM
jgi:hypothetical protein